jgi:myosin heavy subunit
MSKFCVEDRVLFKHPTHSWILGVVKSVTDNRNYRQQSAVAAAGANAEASRKRENSKLLFQIQTDDQLMKTGSELVSNVEEWNVDIYDETIDSRPVDDLLSLVHLHDGTVLRTLAVRYFQDVIYTNIGVIVVAVNPFNTKIPHYQEGRMAAYLACKDQPIPSRLLPHSWSQAHNTFAEMVQTGGNQSILISGESGAGKTEAAKIVLRYLSLVSAQRGDDQEKIAAQRIATTIGNCSPILEAFGNAKTVRNNNSSRFGKLLDLKFDSNSMLLRGAFTTKYLLEKSRIVTCAKDERLFHAFYLALLCPDAKTEYKLTANPESYRSVFCGGVLRNEDFSTLEDFGEVASAMSQVGMTPQQIRDAWGIVAASIHAENAVFKPSGEGSVLEGSTSEALSAACTLWGVDKDAVLGTFLKSESNVRGQVVVRLHNVAKATDSRDALVKALYANLFEWLVNKCNTACSTSSSSSSFVSIQLLDIFGFESFQVNSFEQLCINFANESLQQHYNWCVFTKDMETCQAEGIDTVDITFPNLQPTLDLIGKVLSQLDDACAIGSAEDKDFLQGLVQSFYTKAFTDPGFTIDPTLQNTFGIAHYAGTVMYNVKNWIEKNRDSLSSAAKELFAASRNALASQLLELSAVGKTDPAGGAGRARSKVVTVGGFFKTQMAELMAVINATNPHWIRCVKPHVEKKPRMFSGSYTFRQLEFSGILGTVKIRRAGYPIRFPIEKFVLQFNVILPLDRGRGGGPQQLPDPSALRQHAIKMLQKMEYLDRKHAQVGKTIVFIKSETYHLIEQHKKNATQALAVVLQGVGRGFKRRGKLFVLMNAMKVQRIGRGMLGRSRAFDVFCEKNYARLLAMKEQREAEKRAREEQERLQRLAEELDRRRREEALQASLAAVRSQQLVIFNAEEEGRTAIEAQHNELCTEVAARLKKMRQAILIERAKDRLVKKLQPLAQLFFSLSARLEADEQEEFAEIAEEAWNERRALELFEGCRAIEAAEVAQRKALRAEYNALVPALEEELEATRRRVSLCREREELEARLQRNREKRAQMRREHHDRAASTPRSAVEKVLFNALFRRDADGDVGPAGGLSREGSTEQRLAIHTAAVPQSSPLPGVPPRSLASSSRKRLPIRTVEIGMTVFVPAYSQDGTVRATMPGADTPCFLVDLQHSRRSVWLEMEDMEEVLRCPPPGIGMAPPPWEQQRGLLASGSPKESAAATSHRAGTSPSPARNADAFSSWQREQTRSEMSQEKTILTTSPQRFASWQSMTSMLED